MSDNSFKHFEAVLQQEGLVNKVNPAVLSEVSAFVKLAMLSAPYALRIIRSSIAN